MNLFALSVTLHPKVVMLDVNESIENNCKFKLELFVILLFFDTKFNIIILEVHTSIQHGVSLMLLRGYLGPQPFTKLNLNMHNLVKSSTPIPAAAFNPLTKVKKYNYKFYDKL